jgi:hypothetical protein
MKTSLTEIKLIEKYLDNRLAVEEKLLVDARLLTDPLFRISFNIQKKIYSLLRFYHRKKLSKQILQTHQHLFSDPTKEEFQKSILQLFNH